ncbi:MAG TPA: LL-diaminopimelate aminotransferase [Actinomycetota bacterium]
MTIPVARRIAELPPYLFAELDRKIARKRAEGVDVISLGVGDPDLPTPPHIVEAARRGAADPSTHRYPSYFGMPELRQAIAGWYGDRFGVRLDPETQIQPLIGSKEGIAHLPLAYVDPGDRVLVPDPGYPVYAIGTLLAGGISVPMPLTAEGGFLPDLDRVAVPDGTRLLWLNYPSNPTAAVADLGFLERAAAFASEHGLLLAHDAAYTELTYDGFVAPSALEASVDGVVEFGSVSKTYNMTGWRVGWAAGDPSVIEALATVKTNIDSGIFNALQQAAIAALTGPQDVVEDVRAVYQKRRDLVVGTLNGLGWDLEPPRGSIYVWLPTKGGGSSGDFCELLLDRAGVVLAPGSGYGQAGQGFARISLTVPDDRMAEAMDRIRDALA